MKPRKQPPPKVAVPAAPAPSRWPFAAVAAAMLLVAFLVYEPALNGPFLFDDLYLPMNLPGLAQAPLRVWISGVRPVLMVTYWANFQGSGPEPFGYHAVNVGIHWLSSLLVYLVTRKLTQTGAAAAAVAAIFLLHPLQTESVAYVAGRSESLAGMFLLAAWSLFLWRPSSAVSWPVAAGILVLFGAGMASKEHVIVLPALLLLTDYYFNPGFTFDGMRRNWRIYVPVLAGGLVGASFVLKRIGDSPSAGFRIQGLTWTDYLFTQFRAIFTYLRLSIAPYGLHIDYDYPISRSLTAHGAIAGLIGIVILIGAAIVYRRRWPLASFGLLAFFLFLLPTSSIIPIKDPIAERRMYLPLLGLLLVAADFVPRVRIPSKTLAAMLVMAGVAAAATTFRRNHVWSGALPLWEDTVAKAPGNARARFQLAYAYFSVNRCADAVPEYEAAAKLQRPDARLLIDWGLAYDCQGKADEALAKFQEAAVAEKSAYAWSLIGMIHGRAGRVAEAVTALDKAVQVDPHFSMTYVYRGNLAAAAGDRTTAEREFRRALQFDHNNQLARQSLERLIGGAPR